MVVGVVQFIWFDQQTDLKKIQYLSFLSSIWPKFGLPDIPDMGWLGKIVLCVAGMSNLASELGHIGPKWDKSGTFYDQFQYILARQVMRLDWH